MSIVHPDPFRAIRDFSRFAGSVPGFLPASSGRFAPACDIEARDEDHFTIRLAVPGYTRDELDINIQDRLLSVSAGNSADPSTDTRILHKGIVSGAFKRSFVLAKHVEITGAELGNGILTIELCRTVPEALRPRTIAIGEPVGAA